MLLIILGVLMTIAGIWFIFTPSATFLTIGWILGILLICHGSSDIFSYFAEKRRERQNIWWVVGGILSVIAGLILLFSGYASFLTERVLLYIFGIYMILLGLLGIVVNFVISRSERSWETIIIAVFGVLSILAGIYFIGHPIFASIALGIMIGVSILVRGFDLIALGMKLNRYKN